MDFNNKISGIKEFNQPVLWQAVENYLHVGQTTYQIKAIKDKKITLEMSTVKANVLSTVLKIISYLIVVMPLLALVIKAAYRKSFSFEILDVPGASLSKAPPAVKKAIADFKSDYEQQTSNDKKKDKENVLEKVYTQSKDPYNHSEIGKELEAYLTGISTYVDSQEKVINIVYTALQNLLEKPVSKDRIDFAKLIYKRISVFLRTQSDKKFIERHQEYVSKNEFFDAIMTDIKPAAYLLKGAWTPSSEQHCALIYLLKHLRKQIKLVDKHDKILSRINDNKEIQDIPKEILSKALSYLSLTWMHGTKAFVIKSSCEKSNGEILPFGELRKRNIQVLTGELQNGATSVGINQRSISGVNLAHALVSIEYANNFSFNLEGAEGELEQYQKFLKLEFKILNDFLDRNGCFSRHIETLKRIQICRPEIFQQDKELLERKLEEIYNALKTHIFDKKPKELFGSNDIVWQNNYYTSMFYTFLNALEDLEEILRNPPKKDPPNKIDEELASIGIVVASANKYGIPVSLSTREEPSEEAHLGSIGLGKDIQVVFAKEENIQKVQGLINQVGLEPSVKVESMEVLEAASKIDRALGSYFYDVYNLRKWQAETYR